MLADAVRSDGVRSIALGPWNDRRGTHDVQRTREEEVTHTRIAGGHRELARAIDVHGTKRRQGIAGVLAQDMDPRREVHDGIHVADGARAADRIAGPRP